MYLKNNKGVTLMALTITIIVMLIITGTIIYNTNSHVRNEKIGKLYTDIENINTKIEEYYLKYGEIPTIGNVYCDKSTLKEVLSNNASTSNVTLLTQEDIIINPNDGEEYYIIDLEKLDGLTLNYGYDGYIEAKKATENDEDISNIKDIYIINKETNQIYYPSGIISGEKMYYVYNIDTNLSVTDTSAVFNEQGTTLNNVLAINNFKIYGNSVQNGEPTLDSPVEIESVGEKTKNLLKITEELPYTMIGLTVSRNLDGSINVKGTPTRAGSLHVSKNINLTLPAGTYTLNKTNGNGADIYLLPKYHWSTFTIESDTTYTGAYIDIPESLVGQFLDFTFYPQLEEGSSFTGYEPYGYKLPLKVRGKNLFNIDDYGKYKDSESQPYVLDISNYKVGTKITISTKDVYYYKICNVSGGAGTYQYKSNNYTFILTQAHIDLGHIYIISPNTWGAETQENLRNQNVQIEIGDTATEYEPYVEPITTNIFLDEPLRQIGEYADYIDLTNKKVVRKIANIVYDGSDDELWTTYGDNSASSERIYNGYSIVNEQAKNILSKQCFCNRLNSLASYAKIWYGTELGCYTGTINVSNAAFAITSNKTSVSELRTELSSKPLDVIYILNEPQESHIELSDIQLHDGINILTVDTKIQPSNLELNYIQINK